MQTKYKKMTKDFEGLRLKVYTCTAGKLTIGYGRNLEDTGITEAEASIPEQRLYVLTDMIFNIGYTRVLGFKKMLAAIKRDDYKAAAKEMLDSNWARQVGNRATKLAALMQG